MSCMVDLADLKSEGYVVSEAAFSSKSDEEKAEFVHRLKIDYYTPGSKVKIAQEFVDRALRNVSDNDRRSLLESLKNAGEQNFEVESVYYNDPMDAGYKLKGSDLWIFGQYITDARPTKHMYGMVTFHEDGLYAVELDASVPIEDVRIRAVYEIQGGMEKAFGDILDAVDVADLKAAFAEMKGDRHDCCEAICGEFTIADVGGSLGEIWSLSVLSWCTTASVKELDIVTAAIADYLSNRPKFN